MTTMRTAGKLLGTLMLVLVFGSAAATRQDRTNAGPPVIEAAFDRLTPDRQFDLPGRSGLGVTATAVIVSSRSRGTLWRIDAESNAVIEAATGGGPCAAVAEAYESLWLPLCDTSALLRLNPTTLEVLATIERDAGRGALVTGIGSAWMLTDADGTLARLDPATNGFVAEIYVSPGSSSLTFAADAVWASSPSRKEVTRVNGYNNVVDATVAVGNGPRVIVAGEGALWTLNEDGSVSRIDPTSNRVVATIEVLPSGTEGHLAVGEGFVWVSARGEPLVRIDPKANRVAQRFTGDGGGPIAVGHGSLWLLVGTDAVWRVDPRLVSAVRDVVPENREADPDLGQRTRPLK